MSVFKRLIAPDGTILTNANCIYCCANTGSNSNAGTREAPYATITKAISAANSKYLCINDGIYNESFSFGVSSAGRPVFADKNHFTINGDVSLGIIGNIYNMILNGTLTSTFYGKCQLFYSVIGSFKYGPTSNGTVGPSGYNLIIDYKLGTINSADKNYTVKRLYNYANTNATTDFIVNQYIIDESIDLFRFSNQAVSYYPKFLRCLFRKKTKWMWNGVNIPIAYSADSANWINDIKQALTAYAEASLTTTNKDYLLVIANNSFLEGNVIHDDIAGVRIFNKYDASGNVLDYALNVEPANPALYMSDAGSFIGAFPANLPMVMNSIIEVNPDGNDSGNAGTLLVYDTPNDSYNSNELSMQVWNRTRSNVVSSNKGFSFNGTQGVLESGVKGGFYYGKKQTSSISNVPAETVEILPYDNATTPSAFPKFSCGLVGDTKMWYHTGGDKAGKPVLFSDLVDLGINTNIDLGIYGSWAVTTADADSNSLEGKATVVAKNINVKYFKLELNLHFEG